MSVPCPKGSMGELTATFCPFEKSIQRDVSILYLRRKSETPSKTYTTFDNEFFTEYALLVGAQTNFLEVL